ncbi:Asparagine synthase [compost metagenome]
MLTGSKFAIKDLVRQGEIMKALKHVTDYSMYTNTSAYQNSKKYIVNGDITSEFYHKDTDYYQMMKRKIRNIKDYYKKEIYLQLHGTQTHTFTDRLVGALFGVDVKHPFLDRQLLEYVYHLPVDLIYNPMYTKPVLRMAFSQELTPKIAQRVNKTTHLQYTFKSLRENWIYMEKLIEHSYVVNKLRIVSQEKWTLNMMKWRNGLETSSDFFTLLAIEVWLQKFYERLESD